MQLINDGVAMIHVEVLLYSVAVCFAYFIVAGVFACLRVLQRVNFLTNFIIAGGAETKPAVFGGNSGPNSH